MRKGDIVRLQQGNTVYGPAYMVTKGEKKYFYCRKLHNGVEPKDDKVYMFSNKNVFKLRVETVFVRNSEYLLFSNPYAPVQRTFKGNKPWELLAHWSNKPITSGKFILKVVNPLHKRPIYAYVDNITLLTNGDVRVDNIRLS